MTRKYTWLPSTLIFLLTTLSTPLFAHAQNVAVVNGAPIPSTRANALLEEFRRQGQPDTPELHSAVREELINREILMQEAARRGLPNRPEIKAQLAIAQQSVVIRALIEDFWQQKPSDAELRAAYLALTQKMGNKEYHLHHILLDNEAQAKELISKIKNGASFEELAKQYSKDPGSAKNGGDLDWAVPQTFVPEFAQSATRLKPGQITQQPVRTQFGWHIIRVDNTRALKAPPFEQIKPQLTQQIQQEKLQNFIDNLRAHAKIQ